MSVDDLRRPVSLLDGAVFRSQWLDPYINEALYPIPEILLSILLVSSLPFVKNYISNFRPTFQLPTPYLLGITHPVPSPTQLLIDWMFRNRLVPLVHTRCASNLTTLWFPTSLRFGAMIPITLTTILAQYPHVSQKKPKRWLGTAYEAWVPMLLHLSSDRGYRENHSTG